MNLKQNLLLADVKEAHQLVSATIEMVFDHEDLFKEKVLGGLRCVGWNSGDYSIERCHAAMIYRITLKHDDGREKDLYIPSTDVYSWSIELI